MAKKTAKTEPKVEPQAVPPGIPVAQPTEYVALALHDVVVTPEENCRQRAEQPEEWESFVTNIRTQGLQQPPGVQYRKRGRGGNYHLVFGFRRYSALLEIYGEAAEVQFVVVQGDKATARLVNLLENMARKDLAPFELAESLAWQKRHAGLATKELAEKVGITDRYVDTLIRLKEKLHPDLWTKFREFGAKPPVLTFVKCVSKELAEQVPFWDSIMADKEAAKAARKASKREPASTGATAGEPGSTGATAGKPGSTGATAGKPASDGTDDTDDTDDTGNTEAPSNIPAGAWVEPVADFDEKCGRLVEDASNASAESTEYASGVLAAVLWLRGEGGYPFET